MSRRWLWILPCAAAAILVVWLGARSSAPKPMKQADQELELKKEIDLGLILDTTVPVQLTIPVKNTSSREITVRKIEKDCSCVSIKVDKLKLAPGETMMLRYTANLSGRKNRFVSGILIESDASERFDEIQIRGQITGQVRVRPAVATVLVGDRDVPAAFTIFCDDQDGKWRYAGVVAGDAGLHVELNETAVSPTTSTYEGMVSVAKDRETRANYATETVTFKFVNDALGRSLEVMLPVEIALRRRVTVDPPQVMFLGGGAEQGRTVVLQSVDALRIEAARCASPCIRASIHPIDGRSVRVELVYEPKLARGDVPGDLACEFLSGGKMVGRVPINIVAVP